MDEDDSTPIQLCSSCGARVDVTCFEPLASVPCPQCGAPIIVSKTLGPYDLVEVMGRGGMGVVYRAIDHHLDRQVALKVLRDDHFEDSEFVKKLDEEAAITGGINHPHVVKVYTTGTADGRFFIAMELVDQGTLDDLLEVQGRVAEAQALEIASQIAQGLRAAHQMGLIHRDVKPGNILFANNHQAKIVDFGLAMLEEASKGSDEIWGTPYYVSPERLDQKPEDFRSDIYSLGATIFHAIAGRPPFEAEDATRVALKHLKSQAVSLQAFAPWVTGPTAFVINRMLNKEPAKRYDSYDELIEHLEYARAELGAEGTKPAAKKRIVLETDDDRKMWGQLTFAVLAFVLLLALGTGAYFLFWAPHEQPTTPAGILAASVGATGKHGAEFDAARKLLLADKPVEAIPAFEQIARDPHTTAPLHQWCLVQESLAYLLIGGKLPQAQAAMTSLQQQKYNATTPAGRLQADFFEKLAALVVNPKPSSFTELSNFNPTNYGAIALLLAGLKDWELDDFDSANTSLRAFQSAAPVGEFSWIAEYRPLAEDFLADLSTYRGAMMLSKSAKTPADWQNVNATLLKAKADLHRGAAKLGPKLDNAAHAAFSKAKEAGPVAAAAAPVEAEKAAFAAARTKVIALCKQWNFKEANATLTAVPLANADLQRDKRVLIRKLEWLLQFKTQLIKDLANGYTEPVKLLNGTPLTGLIAKATEQGVECNTAGPAETHAWSELQPAAVATMAETFITPEMAPNLAGDRKWGLGLYALMTTQTQTARRLILDAAKANSQYVDPALLVMPGKRIDLARARGAASASDFIESGTSSEAPANATDGKMDTRWGSDKPAPKWLRVDLGKECHVTRWVVRHAHSGGEPATGNTADFVFQKSTDDKTWTDVDTVQGNTLDVTDRRVPRFRAQYVRLLIKKPNHLPEDNPLSHIYSFEVYGWEGAGDLVADLFAPATIAAPPELNAHDIGLAAEEASGSTMVDDRTGIFNVRSAAGGLGGSSDSCRFLHKSMRTPGQVVIRIDAIDQASPRAEAGVMVREGWRLDARFAYAGVSASGQLTWGVRKEAGGEMTEEPVGKVRLPCWLRLESKANVLTASYSQDGNTWKPAGSEPLDFSQTAELGVATMSRTPKVFSATRFEVINFLR